MVYKSVFDKYMVDDIIMDLCIFLKDDMVFVCGFNNILVYNRVNEWVVVLFIRLMDILKEFKLFRSYYIDLVFMNVEFIYSGKFVIVIIFRNIYLWEVIINELVIII